MKRLLGIVSAVIRKCRAACRPSANANPLPSVLPTPGLRLQKFLARRDSSATGGRPAEHP
jgi:hypothetical protein